ncbi:hypothetical protein [Qipengyuania nanhaisediminis]|uniref:hypothetical protein n=1 Tax=Qipengyuania nanhaisediminis TaxID=604088 RepID=UPI0038B308BE
MIDVTMTQHPVGQGGLMSGLLEIHGASLRWVYDCGSNQTDALNREIAIVAAQGDLQLLFLSHLDSDHVNGIDNLLAKARVEEVVLPYLRDIDRIVAVAHDAAMGTLTGGFLTFLDDIEGWFRERGVERITFIEPRDDDDDGGDGPFLPEGGDGSGEGPIKREWVGQPVVPPDGDGTVHDPENPSVQRLEDGATVHLWAGQPLDWILSPHAHRPSKSALAAFEAELTKRFGEMHSDPNFLKIILADQSLRTELKECYDAIWKDHNLVSMALYAGPVQSDAWISWSDRNYRFPWFSRRRHRGAVGWLCSGDMHLDVVRRRDAFIKHYRRLVDKVNVFALPHHGSRANFSLTLFSELPNASQFAAAAGPNSYGHPSEHVIRAVQAEGRTFVHVSEHSHTALEWRHHI